MNIFKKKKGKETSETTQEQGKPQQTPTPEQQSQPQGPQGADQAPQQPVQPQGANQLPQQPVQPQGPQGADQVPVQPQGPQGANQMPQQPQGQILPYNYPPPLSGSQVVHVQSPNEQRSGPYRSGKGRKGTEEDNPGYGGFSDVEVRRVFVRKVYLILTIQLLFTLGMIALFVFEENTRMFVRKHNYITYMALAVFAAVYLGLICSGNLRRKYPTNIILLAIFTLAVAFMTASISSRYKTNAVLMAVGICAAVCFAVTLFSFTTKFDFTTCGGILCILLLVTILFGIIAIFVQEKVMTMIYSGLGAITFMLYLAYDTQMLMGGKTLEISPEEYIYAAIQLYLDVVYIFLHLLTLISAAQSD